MRDTTHHLCPFGVLVDLDGILLLISSLRDFLPINFFLLLYYLPKDSLLADLEIYNFPGFEIQSALVLVFLVLLELEQILVPRLCRLLLRLNFWQRYEILLRGIPLHSVGLAL